MAAMMLMTSMPVQAAETTNTYTAADASGSILVTATVSSTYTVTLPATLALELKSDNTYEGEYTVGVKANLTDGEAVTVTPNATVTLTNNNGGGTTDGTVTQTVNTWKLTPESANEIASDYTQSIETTGKVSATLTKAGSYSGNLNFTFAKVTN